MLADVAAIQYQFGANFDHNNGDTTYRFDTETGETFIDDVGQGTVRNNQVYRTIWDGNGNDTYDLSNYASDMRVDLRPGEMTAFGDPYRISIARDPDGNNLYSRGNIANAFLYNNDTRSLIENAIAGIGDDEVIGNQANNMLVGGLGDDHLIGKSGDDTLYGAGTVPTDPATEIDLTALFRSQMTASQSSTYQSNQDFYGAGNAVDGDVSTFNHTWQNDEWLSLDLGADLEVTRIVVTNRASSGTRLSDAVVSVQDSAGTTLHTFDAISGATNGDVFTFVLPEPTVVRTVRIDDPTSFLHVGEIQVFGPAGNNPASLAQLDGTNILEGGLGADALIGGAGRDIASYENAEAGIVASLSNPAGNTGEAAGDTYALIEDIRGSDHGDTLIGDTDANTLLGRDGDDEIEGLAGADTLNGGAGTDTLRYLFSASGVTVNLTSNTAFGGDAEGDTISGFEHVFGARDHDDVLIGDAGDNELRGWGGNDRLEGAGGADVLRGGDGFDTARYFYSPEAVTINLTSKGGTGGDADGDILDDIEGLWGSDAFGDVLIGDAADNELLGWGGNDQLEGGAGADTLRGGDGIDVARYFYSTAGVTINLVSKNGLGGDADGDVLDGIESIWGSNGFGDVLIGDAANNELLGWGGDDRLEGGAGADTIRGGDGIDVARYFYSPEAVTINLISKGGTGGDADGDVLDSIEGLWGSDGFGDTLIGDAANNELRGWGGDDQLEGGAGADILNGGTGFDIARYYYSTMSVTVSLATGLGTAGDAVGDQFSPLKGCGARQRQTIRFLAIAVTMSYAAGAAATCFRAGLATMCSSGAAAVTRFCLPKAHGATTACLIFALAKMPSPLLAVQWSLSLAI